MIEVRKNDEVIYKIASSEMEQIGHYEEARFVGVRRLAPTIPRTFRIMFKFDQDFMNFLSLVDECNVTSGRFTDEKFDLLMDNLSKELHEDHPKVSKLFHIELSQH